jgi:hypothetical protein
MAEGWRDGRHMDSEYAFLKEGQDGDEQAANAVAVWRQRADQNGSLESFPHSGQYWKKIRRNFLQTPGRGSG